MAISNLSFLLIFVPMINYTKLLISYHLSTETQIFSRNFIATLHHAEPNPNFGASKKILPLLYTIMRVNERENSYRKENFPQSGKTLLKFCNDRRRSPIFIVAFIMLVRIFVLLRYFRDPPRVDSRPRGYRVSPVQSTILWEVL